jgi:hypothetical protein
MSKHNNDKTASDSDLSMSAGSHRMDSALRKIEIRDAKMWICASIFFSVVFTISTRSAISQGDLVGSIMMPILMAAWIWAGWLRYRAYFANSPKKNIN